jgi:hypothetical protein
MVDLTFLVDGRMLSFEEKLPVPKGRSAIYYSVSGRALSWQSSNNVVIPISEW